MNAPPNPFEYYRQHGHWPGAVDNVTLAKQQAEARAARSPRARSPRASPAKSPAKRGPGRPKKAAAIPPPARPIGIGRGLQASGSGRELKPPRANEGKWRDEAPKTVAERQEMNPRCFLGTRKDGTPGYPICSKGTERISCGGVIAAKKRGAQYHNAEVVAKAEELNRMYGCTQKVRKELGMAGIGRRGASPVRAPPAKPVRVSPPKPARVPIMDRPVPAGARGARVGMMDQPVRAPVPASRRPPVIRSPSARSPSM